MSDATKTHGFHMTIPIEWIPKLEALKPQYGALSIQDVIRAILAKEVIR